MAAQNKYTYTTKKTIKKTSKNPQNVYFSDSVLTIFSHIPKREGLYERMAYQLDTTVLM